MKIINQNGYSKDELRSWRVIVYRNLIESIQTLLQALTDLELKFDNQLNNVCAFFCILTPCFNNLVLLKEFAIHAKNYKFPGDNRTPLKITFIEAVESIWADPASKYCVTEKSSCFYLMDSAP